jgi:RNA polymerase sigma-70 factor (ECF subfamily)
MHQSAGEDLNPETLLLQRANTHLVDQAMRQLPDRWREVLVLRELEGLSYQEIADVVGIPNGTVMSTLSRARERFRHRLSDLVRRQEQPKGLSAVSDGKLQETETDAVPV